MLNCLMDRFAAFGGSSVPTKDIGSPTNKKPRLLTKPGLFGLAQRADY
jgi:hypothetical protein